MTAKKITRMGNPLLKQMALPVLNDEFQSLELKNLIDDLYDTMKEEGGIGIAAPQIGISKQIALIEIPENNERYGNLPPHELLIIINPSIEFTTAETQTFYEGCLSVPGLRGQVTRKKSLRLTYQDPTGSPHVLEASDFFATVIQHEVDHLFGILYVERMSNLKTLSFNEEFEQYHSKK